MATAQVMTLEGFGAVRSAHSRSCLKVGKNKNGYCQCIRYGAPGEGRDFKTLCKESGAPMKIGSTALEGFAAYEEDAPPPLPVEYPPIEDLADGLLGAVIPTKDEFKEALIAAGSATAGILAMSFIAKKVNVNPWIKIGGVAVVGVVGGTMLGRKNHAAGVGLGAGLVGLALVSAISKLSDGKLGMGLSEADDDEVRRELTDVETMPEETALRQLPEDSDIPGRSGMSQVDTVVERKLEEAVGVETERRLGGMWDEAVGVETEQRLSGTWIGG